MARTKSNKTKKEQTIVVEQEQETELETLETVDDFESDVVKQDETEITTTEQAPAPAPAAADDEKDDADFKAALAQRAREKETNFYLNEQDEQYFQATARYLDLDIQFVRDLNKKHEKRNFFKYLREILSERPIGVCAECGKPIYIDFILEFNGFGVLQYHKDCYRTLFNRRTIIEQQEPATAEKLATNLEERYLLKKQAAFFNKAIEEQSKNEYWHSLASFISSLHQQLCLCCDKVVDVKDCFNNSIILEYLGDKIGDSVILWHSHCFVAENFPYPADRQQQQVVKI